jgi:uncharacterized protein involved in exopolysaccharide biosynthesis
MRTLYVVGYRETDNGGIEVRWVCGAKGGLVMKKIILVFIVLSLAAGCVYAESDTTIYSSHSVVVREVSSIVGEWIIDMNDRIDGGDALVDMEKELYLSYVGCYYSLLKIRSLENAMILNDLEMFDMFSSSGGLIEEAVRGLIDSYKDGTYTFEEVYERLSPLLAIELTK